MPGAAVTRAAAVCPESVASGNAGARFETYGVMIEQKLPTRTYLSLSGEILNSKVRRTVGAFELDTDLSEVAFESGLREHLDFRERSLVLTANQLIGDEWSLGARDRLTYAELNGNFVEVLDTATIFAPFQPRGGVSSGEPFELAQSDHAPMFAGKPQEGALQG